MVVNTSGLNSTRYTSNSQVGALRRPPRPAPARRTHYSPAPVAADADCDHGPTGRVAANPKPENSVLVDVSYRPPGKTRKLCHRGGVESNLFQHRPQTRTGL